MILNTTYNNRENKILIDELVGLPYNFWEKLKIKGVGSKRMVVEEVSLGFKHLLNTVSDINYTNIELRRWGILVHINKGLKNFTWVIPYFNLTDYNYREAIIYSEGSFIKFKKNTMYRDNKKFFAKMKLAKFTFDNNYLMKNNNKLRATRFN